MTKPNIFEYLDVHLYLKDFYQFRKKTELNFSYEKWSQEMGLRSRAYLRALVIGEKSVHESILPGLLQSLKLSDAETDYLTLLFRYSISSNKQLKNSYGRQLIREWKNNIHQIVITDINEFLSDSLIPTLFTYFSFSDCSSNLNQIAQKLNCDSDRLRKSIRCLIWQKLIDGRLDEDGNISYKTVQPYFKISSAPKNELLKKFHQEGLSLATKAIDKPSSERKFFSAFFAINEEQLIDAQKMVEDFNQKLLSIFNEPELKEKKIYRFSSQIFPAS